MGGLALVVGAGIGAIALATWSVKDPSLSHATGANVHNLLGTWGAVAADLLMQLFGLAAVAIVLPIAFWGWRPVTHRRLDRHRLRLAPSGPRTPPPARPPARPPRAAPGPRPPGLGGVVGDTLLRLPAYVAGGTLSGTPRFAIAIVFGLATLVVISVASGFGFHTPADDDDYVEEDEPGDEPVGVVAI